MKSLRRLSAVALSLLFLSACSDDNNDPAPSPSPMPSASPSPTPAPTPTPTPTVQSLRIGLLPDTQGNGAEVSMHPMKAVLDKEMAEGVDIVIPVGDLTNDGSTKEFEEWTSVAQQYRDAGIEFLPLMGNHEDSWAYSVEWINTMKAYIPDDAVHMDGAQYLNYYVVRNRVMIVLLKYYNLPIAFQWIRNAVAEREGEFDHIVIASHDGLIGAKYGETREMIVEGVAGDDLLLNQWDEIRAFFSRHDVIWVQGHEHMYQRSLVTAPIYVDPRSWTEADGNYRLAQYMQIMSGNASYKGYEFRYGERELVQRVVSQRINTASNGASGLDATAAILSFTGPRIDYHAWFAEHTITSNADGAKELADPQWVLFDRFSRTSNRCERLVYANSIPDGTRPVMYYDSSYISTDCHARDGSVARMLAGTNDTFNRVDSTTRDMEVTPGFSRVSTATELMRMAYQYLFQFHQPWTPNLNGSVRLVPADEVTVDIPETTIDLKELVMMSWADREPQTASDVLIISGMQNQTGIYQSAYGAARDIEVDEGLPGSQPDGSTKQPHALPATASKSWDLTGARADAFAISFTAPAGTDAMTRMLGTRTDDGWRALAPADCVVDAAFDAGFLDTPPARPASCAGETLVGFDAAAGHWWAVLDQDAELSLIAN